MRAQNPWLQPMRRAVQVGKEQGWRALAAKVRRRARGECSDAAAGLALQAAFDQPLPEVIQVGNGTIMHLSGWCFHPYARIRRLSVLLGDREYPIAMHGYPRLDIHRAFSDEGDPKGNSFRSAFGTLIPIAPCEEPYEVDLALHAVLKGGRRATRFVQRLRFEPGQAQSIPSQEPSPAAGPQSRVVICMTTYNPEPVLFARQIRSIQQQTHENFKCILCDDGSSPECMRSIRRTLAGDTRFELHQNDSRLGFYNNFEKCLSLVPGDAEFIALSDHDDHWHPDKLEALLAKFDSETLLTYSDMNIVGVDGKVYSNTYWTTRPNSYDKLASLLMANTVTGAASMFRASLLEHALPFPPYINNSYHDHWIASVALCLGKIGYVDRPLYDYVQHGENVIGHNVPPPRTLRDGLRDCAALFKRGSRIRQRYANLRIHSYLVFFRDMLRLKQTIGVIRARCGSALSPATCATLARVDSIDTSPASFLWLCLRGLRNLYRITETIGIELHLMQAVAWKHYCKWRVRTPVRVIELPEVAPEAETAPVAIKIDAERQDREKRNERRAA